MPDRLTDEQIAAIEARHAAAMPDGFLLARSFDKRTMAATLADIPALLTEVWALRAELNTMQQRGLEILEEYERRIDALRPEDGPLGPMSGLPTGRKMKEMNHGKA
jgi:hypothetical protein